jgi:uncharacterized protein with PQ loop repeat
VHAVSFATFSTLVGWLAVVLGTLAARAQYARLRRHGIEGVSLATWALLTLLSVFWTVYGVSQHSWQLAIASAVTLPLQLSILRRLEPWSKKRVLVLALGLVVVSCLGPGLAWGWSGAVVGAGVAGILTRAPQMVALLRTHHATGVSASSWTWAVGVSALWVIYYAGAHLWAVLVVTAVAGSASLAVAVLTGWRARLMRGAPSL